jgi:ribosome-associated protein
VKSAGAPSPRTEGEDNGEWIIVDCGQAVVHVMQPAIREYYHLEELWGEKPVRMKLGAPPRRAAAAANEDGHPAPRRPKAPSARRSVRNVGDAAAKGAKPGAKKAAHASGANHAGPRAKPARKPATKSAARPEPSRRSRAAGSPGPRR